MSLPPHHRAEHSGVHEGRRGRHDHPRRQVHALHQHRHRPKLAVADVVDANLRRRRRERHGEHGEHDVDGVRRQERQQRYTAVGPRHSNPALAAVTKRRRRRDGSVIQLGKSGTHPGNVALVRLTQETQQTDVIFFQARRHSVQDRARGHHGLARHTRWTHTRGYHPGQGDSREPRDVAGSDAHDSRRRRRR